MAKQQFQFRLIRQNGECPFLTLFGIHAGNQKISGRDYQMTPAGACGRLLNRLNNRCGDAD